MQVLRKILQENNITKLTWNEDFEPWRRKIDELAVTEIASIEISQGNLLWHPKDILKSDDTPYKVFTQFYKKCITNPVREVVPNSNLKWVKLKDSLNDEELDEILGSDDGISEIWHETAEERLEVFLKHGINGYKVERNYPDRENVSRLSPYLHFGQISPVKVWHAATDSGAPKADVDHFLSELGWREFSYYLLYWFPELPEKNFQPKFDAFPWKKDAEKLRAWKEGRTGYPIVDAGMRQLLQEGYIHNRVRMVVASFLTKNLLLHWHYGRDWFWEHLYDADLANNSASWQWVAGSGADAAPYYRIFNPILQSEKFDPKGLYIKKYLPELRDLPVEFLSAPWTAPAGIRANIDYPDPIIDSDITRKLALEAYKVLKV